MNGAPVTATELADDTLRCSVEKVYRMARSNEIPFVKVGREYRFFPEKVLEHLAAPPASWAQSRRSTGRRRSA